MSVHSEYVEVHSESMCTTRRALTLADALKAQENDYMTRALLYICSSVGNVGSNIADVVGGINGAFAGALLNMANESRQPPSFEETAILFTMLSEAFALDDSLRVHVDYGMEHGKVSDTLDSWRTLIEKNRGTGKKLPFGGLPCKQTLYAKSGCAYVSGGRDRVIDDHGCLMDVNPHEIAYQSEKQEDITMAWHLQPSRPRDIHAKFINRTMARAAGLTFADAVTVCQQRNYGIVRYLLEGISFDIAANQKIGRKLFKELSLGMHNEEFIILLIKMKLPLNCMNKRYVSSERPFFRVFQNVSNYNLSDILDSYIRCNNMYRMDEVMKAFARSIVYRYFEHEYRSDAMNKILEFWVKLHVEEDYALCNVDREVQKSWKLGLLKEIVKIADDSRGTFRTQNCRDDILALIKILERSKQADDLHNAIAEVEYFPQYYSGYSSRELQSYATPLSTKLQQIYNNMTQEERDEYKSQYDDAVQYLRNAVNNGRRY